MAENGTVARITDKGFGFIKGEDGREFFFHRTSIVRGRFEELREGDAVSFVEERSDKGLRAGQVTPA